MAYGQEPDRATTFSITRSRSFMKGTHAVILRCSVFLDKVPAPTRPLITPQKSVTHEEAMEDSVQCRVLQEVGNDQPVMGDGPRTISGRCPTAASLQLQREYLDWSAVPPSRDDVVKDYDAFMAERRETAERERLQQREQRRKEARHARGLLRKPAGQGARYGRPGPRTREKPQQRGGRNTNPSSKRQLGLAAQRQRAADRVVAGRLHEVRTVGMPQRQLHQGRLRSATGPSASVVGEGRARTTTRRARIGRPSTNIVVVRARGEGNSRCARARGNIASEFEVTGRQ